MGDIEWPWLFVFKNLIVSVQLLINEIIDKFFIKNLQISAINYQSFWLKSSQIEKSTFWP